MSLDPEQPHPQSPHLTRHPWWPMSPDPEQSHPNSLTSPDTPDDPCPSQGLSSYTRHPWWPMSISRSVLLHQTPLMTHDPSQGLSSYTRQPWWPVPHYKLGPHTPDIWPTPHHKGPSSHTIHPPMMTPSQGLSSHTIQTPMMTPSQGLSSHTIQTPMMTTSQGLSSHTIQTPMMTPSQGSVLSHHTDTHDDPITRVCPLTPYRHPWWPHYKGLSSHTIQTLLMTPSQGSVLSHETDIPDDPITRSVLSHQTDIPDDPHPTTRVCPLTKSASWQAMCRGERDCLLARLTPPLGLPAVGSKKWLPPARWEETHRYCAQNTVISNGDASVVPIVMHKLEMLPCTQHKCGQLLLCYQSVLRLFCLLQSFMKAWWVSF